MGRNNSQIESYVRKLTIVTALIILVASLEAIILAKSSELIDLYLEANPGAKQNNYTEIILINYFLRIIEPVIVTLFTVFRYKRFGISKLYKFFFAAIIVLKLFNLVIGLEVNSIFYYLLIILYLILLGLVSRAPESKRKV